MSSKPRFEAPDYKGSGKLDGRAALITGGDVRDSLFCDAAVDAVARMFGGLDILVNNAAFQRHQESIEDLTDDQIERTFQTNIFGYIYMARAATKRMPRGSTIINTGSITGLEGSGQLLDYSATKGAIHAFTKSLAQNLVKKGIRVNCVAPGPIWTPPAYVFFASPVDSSYITGEVLTLLGGETTAA